MKRILLFELTVVLLMLPSVVALAESVRIGGASGGDMLPKKFNPSFNYMATPNAPAKSVDFVVYTADQGLQAAGDTCATNGIMGTSAQQLAVIESPPSAVELSAASSYPPNGPWHNTWNPGTNQWSRFQPFGNFNPEREPADNPPNTPNPPGPPGPPVSPEPSTMFVMGIGLAAGVMFSRRRFHR